MPAKTSERPAAPHPEPLALLHSGNALAKTFFPRRTGAPSAVRLGSDVRGRLGSACFRCPARCAHAHAKLALGSDVRRSAAQIGPRPLLGSPKNGAEPLLPSYSHHAHCAVALFVSTGCFARPSSAKLCAVLCASVEQSNLAPEQRAFAKRSAPPPLPPPFLRRRFSFGVSCWFGR